MYIVINKENNESAIIKDKTELSSFINISTKTIQRKDHLDFWENNFYKVYKPSVVNIKSNRGGNRK